METIEHWHKKTKHIIEIYDNDDEIPILNYVQLQCNYLIAAGVGTTISDFDTRLETLNKYNIGGDKKKGANEINNMRNLFWNLIYKNAPSVDAFSSVVRSINDKKVMATDSGIDSTTELLTSIDFTMKDIKKVWEIKKKIEKQLRSMFPNMSPEINIQLFGATKRLQINRLKNLIQDRDYSKEIEKEQKNVSNNMYSHQFGGDQGDDVKLMASFEANCIALGKDVYRNVKEMSAREFYSLIHYKKAS